VLSHSTKELYIIENYVETTPINRLEKNELIAAIKNYTADLNLHLRSLSIEGITFLKTREFIGFYHNLLSKYPKWMELYPKLNFANLESCLESVPCIEFKTNSIYRNLLVSNTEYSIIDFEGSDLHTIMDLLICYHQSLFIHYKVDYLVEQYKKGEWDEAISEAFSTLRLVYDNNLRDEYYFLSLLNPAHFQMYKDSDQEFTHRKLDKFLSKFLKEFTKYYELKGI
jgi:hypothetical protein